MVSKTKNILYVCIVCIEISGSWNRGLSSHGKPHDAKTIITGRLTLMIDSRFIFPKVSKGAKIRNIHNIVPHMTQDTNGKVTNLQLDTTNENQEVSPFPADDHKTQTNKRAQMHFFHYINSGFLTSDMLKL